MCKTDWRYREIHSKIVAPGPPVWLLVAMGLAIISAALFFALSVALAHEDAAMGSGDLLSGREAASIAFYRPSINFHRCIVAYSIGDAIDFYPWMAWSGRYLQPSLGRTSAGSSFRNLETTSNSARKDSQ